MKKTVIIYTSILITFSFIGITLLLSLYSGSEWNDNSYVQNNQENILTNTSQEISKSHDSENVEQEIKNNDTIKELVINSSMLSEWQNYKDLTSGVSFKYPLDWSVVVNTDNNCTYPDTRNYCIDIISPSQKTKISLLILENSNNEISENSSVFLLHDDLTKSLLIRSVNNFSYLRSWWVNAPSYGQLHNLAIDFIDEEIPDLYDLDQEEYNLSGGRWYLKNNNAYYLSYVFNQISAPTPQELESLETVKIMDQILSTLEIDSSVNPFE